MNDQVVTVKNPMRVGTYNYTNNGGMPMTVPVIKGNMEYSLILYFLELVGCLWGTCGVNC